MFDTTEELMSKIRLGEDSTLELKELRFTGNKVTGPTKSDIADELAAMANSGKSVMILGVDDKNLSVKGIPKDKLSTVESWIREICHDSIKPPIFYWLRKIELPDEEGREKPVIRIDVPRSLFVHKSPGGYFRREGSSKRVMEPDVLARLFQQRSQAGLVRFDEYIVSSASIDHLVKEKWQRFRTPLSPKDDLEFLEKIKLITEDDEGNLKPTVTGILIAANRPDEFIPNAFIQAIRYRYKERTANHQIDAKDIKGSVDEQIIQACLFVERNMQIYAKKIPQRVDFPQYAMNAVFEAVVNAAAHRDYSIQGSKIRLHIFSDRLELYSPGSIPNTMTVDSLALRQVSRNETLTGFLARCSIGLDYQSIKRDYMMDKRGEGVPVVVLESEKLSGKRPEYKLIDNSELLLTIYAAEPPFQAED